MKLPSQGICLCALRDLQAVTLNRSAHTTFTNIQTSKYPKSCQVREVLLSYNRSLDKALKNWPEHDVLQNLSSICQKIISFPITSPIIKLLVGLEILLVKSDDWERYASKEFSLRSELNQLIGLIIQWRKF